MLSRQGKHSPARLYTQVPKDTCHRNKDTFKQNKKTQTYHHKTRRNKNNKQKILANNDTKRKRVKIRKHSKKETNTNIKSAKQTYQQKAQTKETKTFIQTLTKRQKAKTSYKSEQCITFFHDSCSTRPLFKHKPCHTLKNHINT
ncbi:MAG TPA: hypothetical protein DCE42_26290 [Myxococcales bacterium]|nr:hypothetical protein [Deltaproteobacteria bacterium]HAA58300.1 hypothetical protein [Myxococcales bacterium]|tara:strand:- start:44988 stop:45419 length:432 start_codon:yes stop_codon:yes gene_type:complete